MQENVRIENSWLSKKRLDFEKWHSCHLKTLRHFVLFRHISPTFAHKIQNTLQVPPRNPQKLAARDKREMEVWKTEQNTWGYLYYFSFSPFSLQTYYIITSPSWKTKEHLVFSQCQPTNRYFISKRGTFCLKHLVAKCKQQYIYTECRKWTIIEWTIIVINCRS